MDFKGGSIVSINDLTKERIEHILNTAKRLEDSPNPSLLQDFVLATAFYEPSTRTRLSFESAMKRLGGSVIGFAESKNTSAKKGETIVDTAKMLEQYADVIVMRHSIEGAARAASEAVKIPVINAGDGANQHPTQTLLDLYTIKKSQGTIDGLHIAMCGDLKYGRTVHSLLVGLKNYNVRLSFVAPKSLQMPKHYLDVLDRKGIPYTIHESMADVVDQVDILYMTRIQKERFQEELDYEQIKSKYVLNKAMLKNAKPSMRVMHPLPRVHEISTDVDDMPHALYFEQAGNGIPVRQALLGLALGVIK